MIENHVVAVGDAHRVRAAVAVDAFAHADETHEVVVRTGEGKTVAVNRDAIAGRGLAGDGDVGLGRKTGTGIINHAAHVENNRASGNAASIAERTRAGITERGDMIDRAATRAGGELAETFRTGKGGKLGVRLTRQEQNQHATNSFHHRFIHRFHRRFSESFPRCRARLPGSSNNLSAACSRTRRAFVRRGFSDRARGRFPTHPASRHRRCRAEPGRR